MRFCRRVLASDPGPWLVALISSFAIWPLLPPGLTHSADGFLHVYRTVALDRLWQQGIFYQRWLPDLALGYGYPLFDFYAPFFYYLSELAHLAIGLSFEAATKLVLFGAIYLHGLGMYLFTRNVVGQRGALLAAAAYMYAPVQFRWAYLYGTYPQFLALAIAPLTLWAFQRLIVTGRHRYLVLGALSYAAVLLSHNLTAFVLSPILGVYILVLCASSPRPRLRLALSATAILFGLGITAFFWFPALNDMKWVQISGLITGTFGFRDHFLSLQELFAPSVAVDAGAHNPYMPYNLGAAQVILAGLGLVGVYWVARRDRAHSALPLAHTVFFSALLAGSVVLMLPVSIPVWEALPLATFLQFPWRLLGLAAIATAGLAGAALSACTGRRASVALVLALTFVLADSMVFTYPQQPFKDLRDVSIKDAIQMEQASGNIGTTSGSEYLPRWVTQFPAEAPVAADILAGRQAERLDRSSLPEGARVELVAESASEITYRVETPSAAVARFLVFYFPGWQAEVDNRSLEATPEEGSGLILVPVPAGNHLVRLNWVEIPHRLAADAVSFGSLLALLAFPLIVRRRSGPSTAPDQTPDGARLSPRAAVYLGGFLVLLLILKEGWIDPQTNWFRLQSPPGEVAGCAHPLDVDVGGVANLICYQVDRSELLPGETLRVTVYWQAQERLSANYLSFVQLVAPDGSIWGNSENLNPGGIPSSGWFRSLYVRDEHTFPVLPEAPPVRYTLQAGLLDPVTRQPVTVTFPSDPSSLAVPLQPIWVNPPKPPDLGNLSPGTTYRFGECITLLGYRWHGRTAQPGGSLRVSLFWRADCPVRDDFTVFAQVLGGPNGMVAQEDGRPVAGLYPTSGWRVGQVVEDVRTVAIPSDALVGKYQLAVGLYQRSTLQRAPVTGPAGGVPDGALFLEPSVEVIP